MKKKDVSYLAQFRASLRSKLVYFFLECGHLVTGSLKLQALGTTEVSSVFSSSFLAPRHQ